MRTDGAIITNAGLELISYAIANNKNITFTKTKLGKGDVNTFDEAKKLIDVVSFYKQIPITSISRNNAGVVRIRSTFTNEDFPIEVVLKEVGIFATVEGKSETLFAYVNDGVGESFPPGSSGNVVERIRDIYVGVSTALDVNVIIDKSVVYATMFDLEEGLNKKEDKFTKNSGFNKNKSDSTSLDDSNTLATSKAVKLTMEKATEASNDAAGKEPKFDKNTAFNKNFGVAQNEVLEGSKLAEILGIEYGGILNNANAKVAGKGYYDTANKKIYKCTANTSINYADAGYFIEVSNNDLLGKLQNLMQSVIESKASDKLAVTIYREGNICFVIGFVSVSSLYTPPYTSSIQIENSNLFPRTLVDCPCGNTDAIVMGLNTSGLLSVTVGKKIGELTESKFRFAFSYKPKQ
ncbi:hypothetical protein [Cetobacterium somerae]